MSKEAEHNRLLTENEYLKKQIEELMRINFSQKNEFENINEELKQTIEELQTSRDSIKTSDTLYRKMNDNSPLGMHFYKLENNKLIFLYANTAANKLLKVDHTRFIGKTIEEAFPSLVKTEIPQRYRRAAKNGISWFTEQIVYDDKKISGVYEVKAFQTSPNNMVAIFNDITNRAKYERELKEKNDEYLRANEELMQINQELYEAKQIIEEREERFRLMIKNSNDAIVLINKYGKVIYVSDAATRDSGYSEEELKVTFHDLVYPEDINMLTNAWKNILEKKDEIVRIQYRHKHKNRDYVWFEALAQNFLDNEAINAVVVNIRDITKYKKTESELQKAKEIAEKNLDRLNAIFKSIPDLIFQMDREGMYLDYKGDVEELFLPEIIGLKVVDILPPELSKLVIEKTEKAIDTGETQIIEYELEIPSKGLQHFEARISKSGNNEIVAIIRNVTENKLKDLELTAAKEKAEESNRLKTAFLQNMSHEIRTPMNAIMGFSRLMAENIDNKKKLDKFSKIIETSCNDLLHIINDILDISKIESKLSVINIKNCDLKLLFDSLNLSFEEYRTRLEKQNIQLMLHNSSDKSLQKIKTDEPKLKQILVNLISNALKFTESGTITCGYQLTNNKLQFYVNDTGVGISADKQEYIFERFAQIKHEGIQNSRGTGLGLPIVKGLVSLLGGDIWLESVPDKGTTFYFTINYFEADKESIKSPPATDAPISRTKKTILIVENDIDSAKYLKEILSIFSADLIIAKNGMAAIKAVNDHVVDLVLMDIGLPDISGYEVTHRILQDVPKMKIIAQTAYAEDSEHQKALDTGCVDYLSKPIESGKLIALITKYLI